MTDRLLPFTNDLDTRGFFRAAGKGELAIRICDGCDAVLHMPRAYCHWCGGWEGRWESVRPTGTVYSWTQVLHQVHLLFPVPYTVVLVQLDDYPGVRLCGFLEGTPDLSPGQPLSAQFDLIGDEAGLPRWRLTGP